MVTGTGRLIWIAEDEQGRRYYSYDQWVTHGETPEEALRNCRMRHFIHACICAVLAFGITFMVMYLIGM